MESPVVYSGGLELRAAGDGTRRLTGKFPYKSLATIHSGGNSKKPRKEVFASKAFSYAIDDPERDIHLLVGHDFGKPIASKKAGTFLLNDTDDALEFEAIITEAIQGTSWWADFDAQFNAGLIGGISPGFRVAPRERVAIPEETVEEDPALGNALIRWIFAAILFELSLVTRPAYTDTEVDLRQFQWDRIPVSSPVYALNRWRA